MNRAHTQQWFAGVYLAAAVNVFGILWTMLFVPALASHSRMTSITAAMNPFKNMSILWETPALRVLSTVFALQVIGATFGHSIWVLYLRYRCHNCLHPNCSALLHLTLPTYSTLKNVH